MRNKKRPMVVIRRYHNMPKGIMLTPEQQEERREEIISVAMQLIEKNGFQKTSMREIAILANMGKSSLYDFFKTKDEIVVYAVEIGRASCRERVFA